MENPVDKGESKSRSQSKVVLFVIAGSSAGAVICALALYYLVSRLPLNRFASIVPTFAAAPTEISFPETAQENLTIATNWFNAGQCERAIPYLDRTITLVPYDGNAYYLRALCYHKYAGDSHVLEEARAYSAQALEDIDRAIQYDVTATNVPLGNPYYARYLIYEDIAGHEERTADIQYIGLIQLDNLRMAEALGTSNKYINQWMPLIYFHRGECEQGWAEVRRIRAKYGLSAPPNASMYNIEGHGYLCQEQFQQALESVDKGLAIESFPERLYLRAILLYYLGRKDEALTTMNGLIAAKPEYQGYRYYFRALIYYDKGDKGRALADLDTGARNTWGGGGVRAYVLGRIAYDEGRKDEAISSLQYAYLTLDELLYQPLFPVIEQELENLGAKPPAQTVTVPLQPTPMPAPLVIPTPAHPAAANGIQLPPDPIPVSMERGTGEMSVVGEYAYPVLLFQPSRPVSIKAVQALTIHLRPASDAMSDKFEIFVWDPDSGEWTMYKPGWHDFVVDDPGQYVDSSGDLYLAIRTDSGIDIYIRQLWVTLEAIQTDGSPLLLDLSPTP